ncbi:PREDICTED: multiple organellar RNA editing factor 8, chloroplastic/mitochondrial-like isoform X3 [Lupinus angustifolius]|uniref:multiple organellar RNA editing factor 8, chloroplastic/mitochondrial-like isoform X3 n=1 Tax=Lupinus angustifolius TaxID=3871 RepID=UPI00092F5E81|nr:PREDICTED: multiple organellar RNA editing factor 8, chloroplastic/mitochondrial-like isoform X3 [Lupinus angustifolius]
MTSFLYRNPKPSHFSLTMATRIFSRVIPKSLTLPSILPRSTTATSLSFLRRISATSPSLRLKALFPHSHRSFSTRATSSSLNDPNPNWSNRPPKETILLDGCDFEHWLVVVEKPEGDPTRDEIIDSYIKILAQVVGSEQEARMKLYSVSTRHYYAFGALVSEELSYKIKELPNVRWVLPDSYLNVMEKDYGGEPFINGQAVPYDPKYHEEWVRNNARANERNRRNDRPRNADRSRNFDRRRENVVSRDMQNPGGSPPSNAGRFPPNNAGGGYAPPNNAGVGYAPPNNAGGGYVPPNSAGGGYAPPNSAGGYAPPNSAGGYAPPNSAGGYAPPSGGPGGYPPNSAGGFAPQNAGRSTPPHIAPGNYPPPPPPNSGYGPTGGVPQNNYTGNVGGVPPNAGWSNTAPNRDYQPPNLGGPAGGNPYSN